MGAEQNGAAGPAGVESGGDGMAEGAADAWRIVEAALARAEEVGWEHVQLSDVAQRIGQPLAFVAVRFRDRDAIADAWFERARRAMLAPPPDGFAGLSTRARLELLLLRWFESLSAHRRVSVQMLGLKMWPFHPHHWVPMLFNLSRTIIWVRDAAGSDPRAPRREVEEVGLTWLFLACLVVWATDDSADQQRLRRFLHRRLATAECLAHAVFRRRSPVGAAG